jgi:hypothetical protein
MQSTEYEDYSLNCPYAKVVYTQLAFFLESGLQKMNTLVCVFLEVGILHL